MSNNDNKLVNDSEKISSSGKSNTNVSFTSLISSNNPWSSQNQSNQTFACDDFSYSRKLLKIMRALPALSNFNRYSDCSNIRREKSHNEVVNEIPRMANDKDLELLTEAREELIAKEGIEDNYSSYRNNMDLENMNKMCGDSRNEDILNLSDEMITLQDLDIKLRTDKRNFNVTDSNSLTYADIEHSKDLISTSLFDSSIESAITKLPSIIAQKNKEDNVDCLPSHVGIYDVDDIQLLNTENENVKQKITINKCKEKSAKLKQNNFIHENIIKIKQNDIPSKSSENSKKTAKCSKPLNPTSPTFNPYTEVNNVTSGPVDVVEETCPSSKSPAIQLCLNNVVYANKWFQPESSDKKTLKIFAKKVVKKKEILRTSLKKELCNKSMNNAKKYWNLKNISSLKNDGINQTEKLNTEDLKNRHQIMAANGFGDYLIECQGTTLNLYANDSFAQVICSGNTSIYASSMWSSTINDSLSPVINNIFDDITTLNFNYMDFDIIVRQIHKIKKRFINISTITFRANNIDSPFQINALAGLLKLDHLIIEEEGNAILECSFWNYYTIFRLSHLKLKSINNNYITRDEISKADEIFASLDNVVTTQIQSCQVMSILTTAKKKELLNNDVYKLKSNMECKMISQDNEKIEKAALTYCPMIGNNIEINNSVQKKLQDKKKRLDAIECYTSELCKNSIIGNKKRELISNIWPTLIKDVITELV